MSEARAKAPRFAVVGHPNKGKSSIVATLASDSGVKIAPRPGTTVTADAFPMEVNGELLYTLIDTPGFENARSALAWLREHDAGADQRGEVVRQFIKAHRGDPLFANEVELLGPIADEHNAAGILYVVDGSIPYSEEYEAEMEVLRWTGQPRMALVNAIGSADYTEAWHTALDQYFSIVRGFNAVRAPFRKHLDLLRAFGELRESWASPMQHAVDVLAEQRDRKKRDAAKRIAEMLADMLTLSTSVTLSRDADTETHKPALEEKLRGKLRQHERRCRAAVEAIYGHDALDREEPEAEDKQLLEGDLFSESSWVLFGLAKRHLIVAGVTGGAVTGGVIDASVGAASFMAGMLVGAVLGGGLGWYSAGRVAKIPTRSRWLRGALSGKKLTCGPITNLNFPFVVLGRARHHFGLIAGRNHAAQGALKVTYDESDAGALNPLTSEQTRDLSRLFAKLRKSRPEGEQTRALTEDLSHRVAALLSDTA